MKYKKLYLLGNVKVSLPLWERGLKFKDGRMKWLKSVAPLVGAWIEIELLLCETDIQLVAPLVGAWIEIYNLRIDNRIDCVAPLVGAWIEIYFLNNEGTTIVSLPLWERGLKYLLQNEAKEEEGRSPCGSVD